MTSNQIQYCEIDGHCNPIDRVQTDMLIGLSVPRSKHNEILQNANLEVMAIVRNVVKQIQLEQHES